MALCPVLDADFAVVGFREDKSKPGGGENAVGQPLVQVMAAQMTFKQLGQPELLQEAEQERDIVDAFMPQQEGFWFHPAALWNSKRAATSYAKGNRSPLRLNKNSRS